MANGNQSSLPAGFVLDQPQAQALPEGFVLDDDNGSIDSPVSDPVSAGVQQEELSGLSGVTAKDVDDALLSIPGAPQLAELAAGANRSIAGFLDFIGPDNVNAILELAGSEKRVPTFTGAIATEGGFVEDGLQREALSTAGEILPSALGIGQVMRSVAGRLPQIAAGETAGRGVVRQLGASKPTQEAVGAVAAGAGQEVGREVGGEDAALVGGVLAPVAVAAIPVTAAKSAASSLLKKSAPSVEQLKTTARGIYQSLDDAGVIVPAKQYDDLADDIVKTLQREGADPDLTQKAIAVANRLQSEKGLDKSLTAIDTLRKVAKNAADSQDKAESRLGVLAVNKIDDFLDDLGQEVVPNKDAGQAFRAARDLWSRARKAELLERAITDARDQASGFENGIRTQFRTIVKQINKGKLKGFTKEEVEAMRKTVQGTKAGNVARFLGKFGVLDGLTSRSLTTASGVGLAGLFGGGGAAASVPLIGQVSGALAQRMTLNNARMAQAIIKAGRNSARITDVYMRNTPKSDRSAAELAELFIKNKAPIEGINLRTAKPLVADAAIIASVAKLNDEKEAE